MNAGVGSKLKEANDQQQFNRNVEDIEVWLGEIEGQLMSEDYGKASKLVMHANNSLIWLVMFTVAFCSLSSSLV